MPPGPAALVKPVPCCVPRLQPCCPAKEVISQQRQVTLSFFFFFFLFFFLFFFSPSPSHPHPPLRSPVLPAPQAVRSKQQTCLHNTTHLHQEERKIKKKKKENQTLRTARRRVPFRLRCPPVPAAPPGSPVGSASASRHGTKWPKLAARRSEHGVEPCLGWQGGFWCSISYFELLFCFFLPLASRVKSTCKAIKKISRSKQHRPLNSLGF